jgi:hypothetical protein
MGALSTTYHHAMVALLGRFDSSARIAAPLQISGIAFLLGMILLASGLLRGRTAPGWVCLGLIAGALGNIAGFATGSLVVLDLGNAALLVCMGYLAVRPPTPDHARTDRRDDNVLSSTTRAGRNDATTSAS